MVSMSAAEVLRVIDTWPVETAAAAVVGPSGVLAGHGDLDKPFTLASVTKPLVARAVQIAIEEGAVELDTPAGPPGSTIRHLLAHASGVSMPLSKSRCMIVCSFSRTLSGSFSL